MSPRFYDMALPPGAERGEQDEEHPDCEDYQADFDLYLVGGFRCDLSYLSYYIIIYLSLISMYFYLFIYIIYLSFKVRNFLLTY